MYNNVTLCHFLGPSCKDRKKNNGETDIDCGGDKCAKCADRKKCKVDCDCISSFCKNKKCARKYQIFVKLKY